MRTLIFGILLLSIGVSGRATSSESYELPLVTRKFFDLNCYECHNDVDKKGELDLESLRFDPSNQSTLDQWAFAFDRVKDGEMPPPEDSLVEPEERETFLKSFEAVLHDVSRKEIEAEGRVKSRRLNRIEYENTIQNLLGVKIPLLEMLPEDLTIDGFSNIAEGQQISYHLLERYLEAVDLILNESFERALNPPPVATEPLPMDMQLTVIRAGLPTIFNWEGKKVFNKTDGKTYRYTNGEFVDTKSSMNLEETITKNAEIEEALANGPFKRFYRANELGIGVERIKNERQGMYHDGHVYSVATDYGFHGRMAGTEVPETGWYRIRLRAKAHNPPEGRNVWGRIQTGILRAKAPAVYWVGKFEAERETKEFVFDAWIQKKHIIGIRPTDKTIDWVPHAKFADFSVFDFDDTAIAVESMEVERIYPGLPPEELRERLFGDLKIAGEELLSDHPKRDLKRLLGRFADLAFRRQIGPYELRPYLEFAEGELEDTDSLIKALHAGYRAILSSHRFLYFQEDSGRLDDYSIASRLSYFLWSGPPDATLLDEAARGRLSKPKILQAQVERMLKDPKADAFARNFADSWLELRDIDFTTPDAKLYPEFDEILIDSMLDETRAFLKHMVDEDLSVTNVIDSDFAMLNERIAKHYGIEFGTEAGLRKVPLEKDHHRGGIITQASVLKVTANGTTTSPIIRGVWILERILGKHVPPPPDQVPAVEPDIRGAVSIRDQLDKHRSTASCMACHKSIDPPGFALENYDVIGGWRQNYRVTEADKKWTDGPLVDPSYTLPSGESFDDIEDFKRLILSDPEQIARNALHQLLVYATGAEIEFADRREVEDMLGQLESRNYGFRSLIHAATQSDIFLSK